MYVNSDGVSLPTLLHGLLIRHLPLDRSENQWIMIRQKHVWEDALHRFKSGLDVNKYLKVTFVGEPAVDEGGPLWEFFHLLISSISHNNNLFCGDEASRVPRLNMTELEKKTYYYVGMMLALSLVHGGPAPHLLWLTILCMAWPKLELPLLMFQTKQSGRNYSSYVHNFLGLSTRLSAYICGNV